MGFFRGELTFDVVFTYIFSMFCQYTVVIHVCRCYLRSENECFSETKYLNYQHNIEGNSSFRTRSLAYS